MQLNDLDTLIPQYAANKKEMDDYKKICDKENATIKAIMKDFCVSHYETGDYKAVCTVSERETMNEEMLLEIVREFGIPDIIKIKECIDFDALEKAIYNGIIPQDMLLAMNKAKEVKYVTTLKVSKSKK